MKTLAISIALCSLLGCETQAEERSAITFTERNESTLVTGAPGFDHAPAKRGTCRPPLRVAYSHAPGWTAFEIGIALGWFKKAGVEVEFAQSDYGSSLDAFSSRRADAVATTHADALALGAAGSKSKMIVLTDYSNGNDEVVARPGIESFRDLRGKKVGLELTLIEHLLFLKACEKNGMKASDVELVNVPTSETAGALTSGEVAAVAAWYPISAQALRFAAGAKPVFTSAELPGLIYDVVAVRPESLAARRDEWVKFAKVWYRISDFVRDPKTRERAVAIMAASMGMKTEEYAPAIAGTYFLSVQEAKKRYAEGQGLDSIYGSTSVADDFNVAHKVYKEPQQPAEYIDPEVVTSL